MKLKPVIIPVLLAIVLLSGIVVTFRPVIGQTEEPTQRQFTNGRLAFALYGSDGTYEIYTINPDGTDRQQLTHNDVDDYNPSWSPDGSHIAFESFREDHIPKIFIMNVDGTRVTRLLDRWGTHPSWSPDGSKVIFSSNRIDDYPDIYTVNLDGTGLSNVTNDSHYEEDFSAWSPTGNRIVFAAYDATYVIPSADTHLGGDIYTINSDGTDKMLLVPGGPEITGITWSPDGRQFAFSYSSLSWVLVIVNTDGSNIRKLGVVDAESPLNANWTYPVWSPDGSLMAAVSDGSEIQIFNPDGTDVITILDEFYPLHGLSWQPVLTDSAIGTPTPEQGN